MAVQVHATQYTADTQTDTAVYRVEAVDDSGQPSMAGPWKRVQKGFDVLLHRGRRVVIETYDKHRHGPIDD